MASRIVLLGATGHTGGGGAHPPLSRRPPRPSRIVRRGPTGHAGGRVARSLVARGTRRVLAGRDPGRLAPLAAALGGDTGPLETTTADVGDPGSVQALVAAGDVLVTT